MDKRLTERLQQWLAVPEQDRDLKQGAEYVLQLTGNRIMYNNMLRNLPKYAKRIAYEIEKHLPFRLAEVTHEKVLEMKQQAEEIAKRNHLDRPASAPNFTDETSNATLWKKGKRQDHDTLPLEVQARYVENGSLMQQMRDLRTRLIIIEESHPVCEDSEAYAFLVELIKKDKQYHENWKIYDSYGRDT